MRSYGNHGSSYLPFHFIFCYDIDYLIHLINVNVTVDKLRIKMANIIVIRNSTVTGIHRTGVSSHESVALQVDKEVAP